MPFQFNHRSNAPQIFALFHKNNSTPEGISSHVKIGIKVSEIVYLNNLDGGVRKIVAEKHSG